MRRVLRPLALLLVLVVGGGFEWDGRILRLERDLASEDPEVRAAAVRRLGAHLGAETREALLEALDDASPLVRAEAAEAVGRARVTAAVPRLAGWLADGREDVRIAAARALGRIGDASARDELVRALGDGEAAVRREAVLALASLGDPEAVVPTLSALDDDDDAVRIAAAQALARMRDERAVVPLVGRARDDVPEVREAVVRALGDLGSVRAIPGILPALDDSNEVVRLAAVAALGRLRDTRGVEALAPLLEAPEARVRQAATASLGAIGGERALGLVAAALADPASRATASEVLVAAAPRNDAVPAVLARALADAGDRDAATAVVRTMAAAQATRAAPALAEPLLDALDAAVVDAGIVRDALARTGAPEALFPLLRAAEAPNPDVAAEALGALDLYFERAPADTRAVDPLLVLLERNPPAASKARIARVLGRLGARRAVPGLVALLDDEDAAVRLAAVEALGATSDPRGAEALEELLGDGDAEVRFRVALAVGRAADAGVVDDLLDRLEGRRPADRHALLAGLGVALPRLTTAGELPERLGARAARALSARIEARDLEAAARALDAARRWGTDAAFALVREGLAHENAAIRRQAARALSAFDTDAARAEARARAFGVERGAGAAPAIPTDMRLAGAAAVALGEIGTAEDGARLAALARERPWPLSGSASFAVARLARRGVLEASLAEPLCAVAALREPYVRANALVALAALGVASCPELAPDALLGPGHDPAVRVAAARFLGERARAGDAGAAAALAACADEGLAELRAACESPGLRPLSDLAVDVYAYDAAGSALSRDRAVALRLADGSVLVANTDRNGHVWLDHAPDGPLLLEDPTSVALEP